MRLQKCCCKIVRNFARGSPLCNSVATLTFFIPFELLSIIKYISPRGPTYKTFRFIFDNSIIVTNNCLLINRTNFKFKRYSNYSECEMKKNPRPSACDESRVGALSANNGFRTIIFRFRKPHVVSDVDGEHRLQHLIIEYKIHDLSTRCQ